MGKEKTRKSSKFLLELDEYYMARKRHNPSFSKVPCPQNFIPGATKARMPNVKLARTASRKVSSVCYQGVLVRMKDNMTTVEKGLVPAALLGLGVPTPSQHTSCLEHELERIRKKNFRKTIESLKSVSEVSENDDIQEEEDQILVEVASMKQRGFSLPVTRGDVRMLPVEDHALADLCREHNLRRSSYPLNREEYDEYLPGAHQNQNFPELDSVTRLGAICRNLANQPGERKHLTDSYSKLQSDGLKSEYQINDGFSCSTSLNVMVSSKKPLSKQDSQHARSVLVVPEIKWQREAALSQTESSPAMGRRSSSEATDDEREDDECKDDAVEKKDKQASRGSRVKSFRERLSTRKSKKNSAGSDSAELSADKKTTFSQIQNAMRSKLPKTLQTTVKMGLSFDPMTVKERNNKARKCDTLTSMLEGRQRSKSGIATQLLAPKSTRSNTLGNIFKTPSLLVSPPDQIDSVKKQEDKGGVFDTIRRLGRRRSTNSSSTSLSDKSFAKHKQSLIYPLLFPGLGTDSDSHLHPMHVRKLEKLLGPEFGNCYHSSVKARSNSLPLIRKNGAKFDTAINLEYGRSISQLNMRRPSRPDARKLFLDGGLNDSDMSSSPSIYESQTDADLSDYEVIDSKPNGLVGNSCKENVVEAMIQHGEEKFVSEAVVFLGRKQLAMTDSNVVNRANVSADQRDANVCTESSSSSHTESDIKTKPRTLGNNKTISGKTNIFLTHSIVNYGLPDSTSESLGAENSTVNGIHESKNNNTTDEVTKRNIANKFPNCISTELISFKKSKTLKTTQELIADSKLNRDRRVSLKDQKIGVKDGEFETDVSVVSENHSIDANHDAIAELDALLLELETYDRS